MATPINRDEIAAALAAIARRLDNRVEIWRVILNADGTPTSKRVYCGSFNAPPDWQPPTFERLMTHAKGRD